MKKFISFLLVLAMVLSASAMAFATTDSTYGTYGENEIVLDAEDAKGKDVTKKIDGEYLKSSDAVYKLVKKADDAEDFVESIGVEDEVNELVSDYKIAKQMVKLSGIKSLNYPIDVTFAISGVKKSNTVVVLLYTADKDWVVIEATAGSGKVTATFEEFGKVVVLVGEEPDYKVVYNDVYTTDWFYSAVKYCTDKGYLKGVGYNTFGPNTVLTRAMVVETLYRMAGSPSKAASFPFTDCPDAWYKDGVAWAYTTGISTGYSDKSFGPNDPVTREQLVSMIGRYHEYRRYTLTSGSISTFADASDVSSFAKSYVEWAVGYGLISGRGINGKVLLAPKGQATRAEFAQMIYNYMK